MRIKSNSQAYPYVVTVAPSDELLAVTADDLRTFLRIDKDILSDEDAIPFILAGQSAAERYTKLTFFLTTFETKRDCFVWGEEIQLRRAPLQSITSINYLKDAVETTVATTVYKAIKAKVNNFGRIALKESQVWPSDEDNEAEAVTILFVAGMTSTHCGLPHDLTQGILRVISDLYYNRGDCSCSDDDKLSAAAKVMLGRFRILGV